MDKRTLNHFALFRFSAAYWGLPQADQGVLGAVGDHAREAGELLKRPPGVDRDAFRRGWLPGLRAAARRVEIYQVFPIRAGADLLVWSALEAEGRQEAHDFFTAFARATTPWRSLLEPVDTLWGFTRPSQYSGGRTAQEIDPFAEERKPYLIMYPFVKTADWYMMSRDARQGMMNEHIRVGRQYPEITQLLLYSVGLQDQEFVVVYEADDAAHFSGLVSELRATEARRFTERDTPIYTAVWHPAEETLGVF